MMKLKTVGFHLLYAFADVTIWLQASQFAVLKSTMKIAIDPLIGDDSQKGPPVVKNC